MYRVLDKVVAFYINPRTSLGRRTISRNQLGPILQARNTTVLDVLGLTQSYMESGIIIGPNWFRLLALLQTVVLDRNLFTHTNLPK